MSAKGTAITLLYFLLAGILILVSYAILDANMEWTPYAKWLVGVNIITFFIYGVDKNIAQGSIRAPRLLLNLLAALGGFIGGWLGMFAFDHKTNYGKHSGIWFWLALSTLGHFIFIYDRLLS